MMEITINVPGLKELADAIMQLGGVKIPVQQEQPVQEQPQEQQPQVQEQPQVQTQPEETRSYTLVDVRGKLSELTKAGKKEKVQSLIKSFGVDKLSKIPEDRYAELMEKAGEL